MAERISKLYQEVKSHLELANDSYNTVANSHKRFKEYQLSDLVIVYLRKSRFLVGHHSKIINKCMGPFQILERFSPNATEISQQT